MRAVTGQRQSLQSLAGFAVENLNGLQVMRFYSSGDTPDRSSPESQKSSAKAPQQGSSNNVQGRPNVPSAAADQSARGSRVRLQAGKLAKMMDLGAEKPGPPGGRNTMSSRVKVDLQGRPINPGDVKRPRQRLDNDPLRGDQTRVPSQRPQYRQQRPSYQPQAPRQQVLLEPQVPDPSNLDPEDIQEEDLRGQGTRRAREKALRAKNRKDDTGTMDVFQGDLRDKRGFRPSQRRSRRDEGDDASGRPRSNRPPIGFNEIATPAEKELQRELGQFILGPDEHLGLIDRVTKQRITSTADMPITDYQAQGEIERISDMDGDPTVNINWLSPRKVSADSMPDVSVDKVAEQYRGEWSRSTGLTSDEDWNEYKKEALQDIMAEVDEVAQSMGLLQGQREEQLLLQYLDKVEVDNPSYVHVAMTIHQLNRNPFWEFQQKTKYLDRLIKTVNDPRLLSEDGSQQSS